MKKPTREVFLEDNKIRITFPYDSTLITAVKSISGRSFRSVPYKHWFVPYTPWHCEKVMETLKPYDFTFSDDIKKKAKEATALKSKAERTTSDIKMGKLRDYQVAGVEFMESADGRCLNCDQMGLGKTAQALYYAERNKRIRKILVVAPATVTYNWGMEIDKWTSRFSWAVVATAKEPLPDVNVFIMSYNIATSRYVELMENADLDLVIFDEFHYIKNPKAKRTRAAKIYASSAIHVIGLSGTPMLSRPFEMLNMLQIIQPGRWDTTEYAFQYCDGWNSGKWAGGASNTEELADRLKTIMIRRTKDEVDLPDLTRTYVPVVIDKKQYREVAYEVAKAIRAINPTHKGYYVNALDKLNMLRQVLGGEKARVAMEWVTNFLDSQSEDTKLVIYAHHRFVVDNLLMYLKNYGVTCITGDVPTKERMNRIKRFQSPGNERVIVITSAGGEGINLFGTDGVDASNILFVERQWTPAAEEQAESRLHRIGQKNAVNAYYLVAKDTVDETISQLIESKRRVIHDIVGTEETEVTIVKDLLDLLITKGE